MRVIGRCFLPLALTIAGCASTPGARPHDMSVAQHEGMANEQARLADREQAQYDPSLTTTTRRCSSGLPGKQVACWSDTTNPSASHLNAAERHRRMAADHRAASRALRDAEAEACSGIADEDRDTSPFEHADDIAVVRPLEVADGPKGGLERLVGATVTVRAVPGMSTEWLQRIVDCHLARNASVGHYVPEMPSCPLVPKGVEATVTSTGDGFAIAIRAGDSQTAREVLRRAQSLKR